MKIKVGDKVEVVDTSGGHNKPLGFIGIVTKVKENTNGKRECDMVSVQGILGSVYAKRFKRVTPIEPSNSPRDYSQQFNELPNVKEEILKESKTQEIIMKKNTFETRQYVNGNDVANMSKEQLITTISDAEDKIASLEAIKAESKAIKVEIKALQVFINQVVKVLDKK